MSDSEIEWTGKTWNPTTGCDRISAGCDHCYALTMARRLKAMGSEKYQSDGDPRTSGPGFGVATHPETLGLPYRWHGRETIFVNSMSDLLHARVPDAFIDRVFEVMEATPRHTYQILTKRATRLSRMAKRLPWPSNVWMGVSVENAEHLRRVDHLRSVHAAVRFVSAEPLIGSLERLDLSDIHWLIIGGESGTGARPMDLGWARELLHLAASTGTAVFVKQLGTVWARETGHGGVNTKGGNWEVWPSDLQVRNYPDVPASTTTLAV